MPRRSVLRLGAKWGFASLVALLLLLHVFSAIFWIAWNEPRFHSVLSKGAVRVVVHPKRGIANPFPNFGTMPHMTAGKQSDLQYVEDWYFRPRWSRSRYVPPITQIEFPLWVPMLVSCGLAIPCWWPEIVAFRRRRAGHCHSCGYDRRGLAPDARCPECGAVASK